MLQWMKNLFGYYIGAKFENITDLLTKKGRNKLIQTAELPFHRRPDQNLPNYSPAQINVEREIDSAA